MEQSESLVSALPSLFDAGEIESRPPIAGPNYDEGKRLSLSVFLAEEGERRRARMADTVAAFEPLFQTPTIPLRQPATVKDLARTIRCSEGTVLRIMLKLNMGTRVKKRGHMSERLPFWMNKTLREYLLRWWRANREGVLSSHIHLTPRHSYELHHARAEALSRDGFPLLPWRRGN